MEISRDQFDRITGNLWRERLARALRKSVPGYGDTSQQLRDDFLTLAIDAAEAARFRTEQGAAGYVLGAWYLEPGFESRSRLLVALFASALPEFRRLHAMNGWLEVAIREPNNVAAADDGLRKAFEMTHAWGIRAAGSN